MTSATSQWPHLLMPSPLGVKISTQDFGGGHRHVDPNMCVKATWGRRGHLNGVSDRNFNMDSISNNSK